MLVTTEDKEETKGDYSVTWVVQRSEGGLSVRRYLPPCGDGGVSLPPPAISKDEAASERIEQTKYLAYGLQ